LKVEDAERDDSFVCIVTVHENVAISFRNGRGCFRG